MKSLSKEQLLGILRHVLTFAGGFLVLRGLVDESLVMELSGAIVTLVGGIWSILDKNKKELK
jgi:hypothetical protein